MLSKKTETLLVSKPIRISNLIPRVLSVLDPQSKREKETLVWSALSPLPSLSFSLSCFEGRERREPWERGCLLSWFSILKPYLTIAAFILITFFNNNYIKARNLFRKYPKFMKNLNRLFLSLWRRNFFHVHPGHRDPSCDCISRTETFAVADPESHAHSAFVDFIADSFDVTWAVQIF